MISVRKATLNDVESIATYFLLAMEDIVCSFIGEKDPIKARQFMEAFVAKEGNQYSYTNCWVAEEDGKVVGAINIYDGAMLSELRQPVIEYVKTNFNRDFTPDDETQAGEYYLDCVGVASSHQGKGIGTSLLRFAIDEYVTKQQYTLGLLVDEVNADAKRLYLKVGFKSAGRRIVFGKNMEHLQITI